ncbi:hypothetical protein EPN18_06855 [bacterium]|nr:MAG: hypothetical protein EPN18_06855 [bacterium]
MKVVAKKGTRCPMEGKPRNYITDTEPFEAPDTSYYLRLIADGSLTRIEPAPAKGGSKTK